jgi:diguanylate cyclase
MHSVRTTFLHDLIAQALAGDPAAAGFEVCYQPIVSLSDARTVAVEALARWGHPVVGEIEPCRFVAAAEYTRCIGVLDDFVLRRACSDAAALAAKYGVDVGLHVNVSAVTLQRPGLDEAIGRALDGCALRPDRLTLEITETVRIDDLDAAAECIRRLHRQGVHVVLDDFGSAFNDLQQLHVLPVDGIKLDAALISPQVEPWRTEVLCRSLLSICQQMGLTAVAEGIETARQTCMLQAVGFRFGQGFLYGEPSRLEEPAAAGSPGRRGARG